MQLAGLEANTGHGRITITARNKGDRTNMTGFCKIQHTVMETWYKKVNCSCCKHNEGMMLMLGCTRIWLYVLCNCKLAIYAFDMDKEAFELSEGKLVALPVAWCEPEPIDPEASE
jgi:hypothetical protein